jgi:uncharacterized protein with von Willebrand factor type A (vWA) domain
VPASLTDFAGHLRSVGVPVGVSEVVDAAAAVREMRSPTQAQLRSALAATLIKNHSHRALFDLAFDDYLTELRGGQPAPPDPAGAAAGPDEHGRLLRFRELLTAALARDDQAALRSLAELAVASYGGLEPGRVHGTSVYLLRTLRVLQLDAIIAAAQATAGLAQPAAPSISRRLLATEVGRRGDQFASYLESAVRRSMIADLGREAVQAATWRPPPTEAELTFAQPADFAALRQLIPGLSRTLQLRLQRIQAPSRAVDFRRTIRTSLATGGAPAEIVYRRSDPPRPELVVLADVSGSVAQFATFTLYLLHSLSRHFGRVRSFAFIDGIDEVTDVARRHDDPAQASRRIISNSKLIWFDGHSDYGHALESFLAQWGNAVSPRTTVLILGDGRSNYRDPCAWTLRDLARRASSIHWLNPEPRAAWGTGDSAIDDYRRHCTSVTECRTFSQVARFIEAMV